MKLLGCFIKIPHVPCAVLLSAAFLMQKSAKMIESVECLALQGDQADCACCSLKGKKFVKFVKL